MLVYAVCLLGPFYISCNLVWYPEKTSGHNKHASITTLYWTQFIYCYAFLSFILWIFSKDADKNIFLLSNMCFIFSSLIVYESEGSPLIHYTDQCWASEHNPPNTNSLHYLFRFNSRRSVRVLARIPCRVAMVPRHAGAVCGRGMRAGGRRGRARLLPRAPERDSPRGVRAHLQLPSEFLILKNSATKSFFWQLPYCQL